MANKVLEAVIKARDEASATFKNVGKEAENAARSGEASFKAMNAEGAKHDSILSRLAQRSKELRREQRASGESALSKVLASPEGLTRAGAQALGLGLPVMIADRAGESLANVAGKIAELQRGLREGTEDWRSALKKTLEDMPVVGGFAKAGSAIREMFAHEREGIETTNWQTELLNRSTENMAERAKDLKAILLDISNSRFAIKLDLNLAGKEGYELSFAQLENKIAQEERELQQKQTARLQGVKGKYDAEIKKLQEQLSAEQLKAGAEDPIRGEDVFTPAELARMKALGIENRTATEIKISSLVAEITKQQNLRARDLGKVEGEQWGERSDSAQRTAAERSEWLRKSNTQALKIISDYHEQARNLMREGMDQEARDIRANNVLRLQAQGAGLAAEIVGMQAATAAQRAELQRQTQQQAEAIQQRAAEQAKLASPEKAAEIKRAADAAIAALQSNANAKGRELNTALDLNTTARIKSALDESNLRILQMQAAAGNDRARVEAETVARLNEELTLRKNLQQIAGDKTATAGERQAAQARLQALDDANRQRRTRQIEDLELAAQDRGAELGTTYNERLENRQKSTYTRLLREFNSRKAEVEALLGDQNATDEQKAKARAALDIYARQSGRAFDRAIGAENVKMKPTADTEMSPYIAGRIQAATQKAEADNAKADDLSQKGNELLAAILEAIKNMEPAKLEATVGVPYGSR